MAALALASPGLSFAAVAILLALLGTAGGFFVVPVNALIQRRPAPEEKGRTIAVANLLSFVGVALQPLAQYGMLRLGPPRSLPRLPGRRGHDPPDGPRPAPHDARPWRSRPGLDAPPLKSYPIAPVRAGAAPTAASNGSSRLCMSTVATLPGAPSAHRGLSHWMERVLKELEHVRKDPAADPVHDLRVAIRRCRSVAAVMQEVDPGPRLAPNAPSPQKAFSQAGRAARRPGDGRMGEAARRQRRSAARKVARRVRSQRTGPAPACAACRRKI